MTQSREEQAKEMDEIFLDIHSKFFEIVERRVSEWIDTSFGVDFSKVLSDTIKERDSLRGQLEKAKEALRFYAENPYEIKTGYVLNSFGKAEQKIENEPIILARIAKDCLAELEKK